MNFGHIIEKSLKIKDSSNSIGSDGEIRTLDTMGMNHVL